MWHQAEPPCPHQRPQWAEGTTGNVGLLAHDGLSGIVMCLWARGLLSASVKLVRASYLASNVTSQILTSPSVQFSSVAQSCPTLCGPMNRSTPGLPVHHQLPEFTQTCVHRVSDAIQPSHPLSSPSSPAPSPLQHQSLFQ